MPPQRRRSAPSARERAAAVAERQGDRNAVLASSASARGKNECDVRSRTLGQASRRTASLGPARTDGSSRLGLDGGPSFDRRCSFVPARRARRASYQTSSTGAPAPTFSTASAALASHCTTPHRRVRVPSCDLRKEPRVVTSILRTFIIIIFLLWKRN